MAAFRSVAFLAAIMALGVVPAQAGHAAALPAAEATLTGATLVLGVDPWLDLADVQPAQLAARLVRPGQKADKCSFVPSKNPVKPKRNACRFA